MENKSKFLNNYLKIYIYNKMSYLNHPIAYLVDSDLDQEGNLINPDIPKDKPVIIMIQANFCGHCTKAKPEFQKFAEKNKGKVFAATIQGDGKEKGEPELSKRLSNIFPDFRGFPEYVKYNNGKFEGTHDGGRSVEDLEKFIFKH